MPIVTQLINDPPEIHVLPSLTAAEQILPVTSCDVNNDSYSKGKSVKCFLFQTVCVYFSGKFSDTLSTALFLIACLTLPPQNKHVTGCLIPLSLGADLLLHPQEWVSSSQVSPMCLFPSLDTWSKLGQSFLATLSQEFRIRMNSELVTAKYKVWRPEKRKFVFRKELLKQIYKKKQRWKSWWTLASCSGPWSPELFFMRDFV